MANPWLLALKVIPWGDVIEHAPKVLGAARKLMDRQGAAAPPTAVMDKGMPDSASDNPPSLGELKNRLISAQQQIDQQAQTQTQLTQTVAELAEQNARLVAAIDMLRLRTRLLIGLGVAQCLVVLWLALR